MLASHFKNRRGIALLMTIAITTVLVTAALELNRQVRATVEATATARDYLTLTHIASSGIEVGMAMLAKDRYGSRTDSVQEDWADPDKIGELLQEIPFEAGSLALTISDELGKIQVNALLDKFPGHKANEMQCNIWENLLQPLIDSQEEEKKKEINAAKNITDSVKDWLDSKDDDAITGFHGAESDYYESLDPPYSCRNGPIPHLNELLLIKGVTEDIFQGTNNEVSELPLGDDEKSPSGIFKHLTVHGVGKTKNKRRRNRKNSTFTYPGKININTADIPVLKALVGPLHEECAQAMVEYRQEHEVVDGKKAYVNRLSSGTWYRSVTGCGDVQINSKVITNASDIFRIESTGTLHDTKMTIAVVVKRERDRKTKKWKCRILSWQRI